MQNKQDQCLYLETSDHTYTICLLAERHILITFAYNCMTNPMVNRHEQTAGCMVITSLKVKF